MTREEAIKELKVIANVTIWNDMREAVEMAIEALQDDARKPCKTCGYYNLECPKDCEYGRSSAEAVQGYAEWLEKIIVDAETLEWLCEDTPCKEWCDENCHYKSIQAECLRHMYEVSKGGDAE